MSESVVTGGSLNEKKERERRKITAIMISKRKRTQGIVLVGVIIMEKEIRKDG